MKTKRFLRLLVLTICVNFISYNTNAFISKTQAISIVTTQIYLNQLDSINIYLYPDSITAIHYKMCPYDSLLNPYSTSWLFFVDIEPWYNWDHNCRYIFINYTNGNYQIINDHTPPLNFKDNFESISVGFEKEPIVIPQGVPSVKRTSTPDPHKYAIIFSGDGDTMKWNNMSHIYCALQENYGFTSENMIVLSFDGEQHEKNNWSLNLDQDENNTPDIDDSCTKNKVFEAFDWMKDHLGDEDLLFVFATCHGYHGDPNVSYLRLYNFEPLWDHELAPYVDAINCSEMIFILDACHSGGFVDNLEGDHRVVYTPVPWWQATLLHGNWLFDDFSYAWATTLRGYHALSQFEPWNTSYPIGENPDIDLIFPHVTVDINPDVTNGGNNDGLFQTNEALNYGIYLSEAIEMYHEERVHTGFNEGLPSLEGLLSLHGISGTVTYDQSVSGPFLIGNRLILDNGVELTIQDNSKFYLNPNATIETAYSSSIIFNDNLEFWGFDNNNSINIAGSCLFGENISFNAPQDVYWVGLNIDNTIKQYEISSCTFTNCDLNASCYNLAVDDCDFTNSGINFTHGNLSVNECSFTHACIIASYPYGATSSINVDHCDFINTGYSSGSSIVVDDYNSYVISNCTIAYDYHAHGIGIFYAGNFQFNDRLVTDCEIYNPPSRTSLVTEGIFVYNSISDIQNNNIHNNGYGIALLNISKSTITGKEESSTEEETQRIKNNIYNQVIISENCFPDKFEWNSIYNNDNSGIYIRYLSECEEDPFEIKNNYWNEEDNLDDHLYPFECYNYKPMWNLQGQLKDLDMAKVLYDSTIVLISLGSFNQAESIFKDIILTYPLSKYAVASIKDLFYLKDIYDNDYQGLQYYYDSIAINTEQHNLAKLSRFFSNQCDVELGNYQDAINWNDSVLLNPESFEDSIFALIDRDYVYLRMQHETGKSDPVGIPSFVPKTHKDFIIKRDELLDLLKNNDSNSAEVDPPDNYENQDFEESLHQNYPNPFKDHTTFSFTLAENSDVSLCIYDQLGRKVMSFPIKFYSKGTHSIDFMNDKLSPGVYFYKILINNKPLDAKKLMVL
ncbi:MAG: T9SS type A sorting domain-containing protein [Bacteroidales bacterium]|nr:T9SS type A sorting domain-containing protein [Bacteroidales bacterium]